MRLKKLVLQGYKTFASKTEFIFEGGITAVVGPNGSGKSNVADAVRWVLGEQSYSTLRGKRTTDMIFAGSEKRARAGMASATLTLDNHDGWLPIDYTEVEICRRAYRSGENEYLLNGQKVRLMDVNDLLARAGVAEQTYTIIGQGLIDQALSLKADERRALFEEAAGISHYKNKRATTLRRLQETERNLLRINDILSEIKPRLSSLKRQASRAQNYEQVRVDLHHLLRIWYGYQWEKAKKSLRERRQTATTAEQLWQKERAQLLAKQDEIERVRQTGHELQEQIQAKQTVRENLRGRLEQARREVAILQERRVALERQLGESSEDLPLLQSQQKQAAAELEAAVGELTAVQNELNDQQVAFQKFEGAYQQQQAEIKKWQNEVRTQEGTLRQLQTKLAQGEGQLAQLQERLAEQSGGAADDTAVLNELTSQSEKLQLRLNTATQQSDDLRQQVKTLQAERRTLEKELRDQRRQLDQERQKQNEANNELARQQARVELLQKMRTPQVKISQNVSVAGQLSQFVTIPEPYQRPIELALQAQLAALIVPSTADVWHIAQNRSAKEAVLLLNQAQISPPPLPELALTDEEKGQVLGWAGALVTARPGYEAAVAALLNPILLVQTARLAYEIAPRLPHGYLAVSPDGFVAHANGLVELVRQDGQTSLLAQEAEYRQAAQALEQMTADMAALTAGGQGLHTAVREQQKKLDELQKEERRLSRLMQEAEQRHGRVQRDLERQEQQVAFTRRQQAQRAQEQTQLQERIAQLEQAHTKLIAARDEQEQAVQMARETLAALPVGEADQQRQVLRQQINATRAILDGRRAIVDNRRATLNQLEKQIARLQARRQEWSTQLLKMDLPTAEEELAALGTQMAGLAGELEPLQERLTAVQKGLRVLEGDTAVVQRTTHELETRYTQAKITLSQQETHIENLKERISTELGLVSLSYDEDQHGDTPLPFAEVVQELPTVEELPEGIEESVQKRREQLSRMGAINPDAPAEYEELQERHDFLEQQLHDLEETDKQLRHIITELDELTSQAFAETVQKVNVTFKEMFTRLFGGGAAELVLTEPDDLTISGVDIIAQLPGRRPQGLALLSGGERSLTAASLIFALLKVSPTPFCMMDEVDAALDEANVTRFRDVLQELSEKIQFVVITHNRGTVQAAQTIYGITMGSDSASQVISVRPEEYVTQAELWGEGKRGGE